MLVPWLLCLMSCAPDEISLYRSPLDRHLRGHKTEMVYIAWHNHPYFLPL